MNNRHPRLQQGYNFLYSNPPPPTHVANLLLTEPKVGKLDVPLGVQQDVLRLQVAVQHVALVQVGQGDYYLGQIETGGRDREGRVE